VSPGVGQRVNLTPPPFTVNGMDYSAQLAEAVADVRAPQGPIVKRTVPVAAHVLLRWGTEGVEKASAPSVPCLSVPLRIG